MVEVGRGFTAALVSLGAQIIGLILGLTQVPIINPVWVEGLIPILAQIPLVGPYLEKIPLLVLATIFGFIILWCIGYVILGAVAGSWGLILALGIGAVLAMWLYGGIAVNVPFKWPSG